MTRTYRFYDDDHTFMVEFKTDQIQGNNHFQVLDVFGLDDAEAKSALDFRQLPYHEEAFKNFAQNNGMNLDRLDNDASQNLVSAYTSLSLDTASLSDGSQGSYYLENLSSSGGIKPYSYKLASGSLPNGVRLTSSGSIHGTPTETGTFNPTIEVSDAVGKTASASYSFSIA